MAQEIEVRLLSDKVLDDERIARRALNVLRWSVSPPIENVKVTVEKGRVAIEGEATRVSQRMATEQQVQKLGGITGIVNLIKVKSVADPQSVRAEIRRAFRRNADLESKNIAVKVEGGRIILTGKVRAWYERSLAEQAVWAVPGVAAIEDRIRVEIWNR